MKLITKAIEKKLRATPIGTHRKANPEDIPIIVKFFPPWGGWSWFVTEADYLEEEGTWLFWGMVHGFDKEQGTFLLSELESVIGPFGLKIERDMHYDGHTLQDVMP